MNKHGGFNSNKKNFSRTNIKFKRNLRASTILEAAKYSSKNYSFNKFRFMQADKFCCLSLNRIYGYRTHFSMIIYIDSFCDYTIDHLSRFNGGRNIEH